MRYRRYGHGRYGTDSVHTHHQRQLSQLSRLIAQRERHSEFYIYLWSVMCVNEDTAVLWGYGYNSTYSCNLLYLQQQLYFYSKALHKFSFTSHVSLGLSTARSELHSGVSVSQLLVS